MGCKLCRFQTSVTAGTIFDGARMPLVKLYWMIYHMAMDKVGVSLAEMQRLLDIKQYRTAWLMAHKIRKAMADRDAGYSLAGLVEMDDSKHTNRVCFNPPIAFMLQPEPLRAELPCQL